MQFNPCNINIIDCDTKVSESLIKSIHSYVGVNGSQLFYPIFQHLAMTVEMSHLNESMYKQKIFDSKYKCIEIVGVIDDDFGMDSPFSSRQSSQIGGAIYNQPNDIDNIDDCDNMDLDLTNLESEIFNRKFEVNDKSTLLKYGIYNDEDDEDDNTNGKDEDIDCAGDDDGGYMDSAGDDDSRDVDHTSENVDVDHTSENGDVYNKSLESSNNDTILDFLEKLNKINETLKNDALKNAIDADSQDNGESDGDSNSNDWEDTNSNDNNDSNDSNDAGDNDRNNDRNNDSNNDSRYRFGYGGSNSPVPDLDKLYASSKIRDAAEIRFTEQHNNLINNMVVLAKISLHNETSDEYLHKIFIKKSPLLEPTKVARGFYSISPLSSLSGLPDIIAINTMHKLNNINNSSHVEAIFLYMGNLLVEHGLTIAFPYYYGCLNAIDPNFHFNITDEYFDLKDEKWFQERIATDLGLVVVDSTGNLITNNVISDSMKNRFLRNNKKTGANAGVDRANDGKNIVDNETNSDGFDNMDDLDNEILNTVMDSSNNIMRSVSPVSPASPASRASSLPSDVVDLEGIDIDRASFSSVQRHNPTQNSYFLKLPNMPVNLVMMEYMDRTLDDMLEMGYVFNELEWQAIIFQIGFGLAIANKYMNFVHNDLHSSNVMIQDTEQEYIYYKIANKYYKIPTFGRIYKIIDFARATFKLDNYWVFSDVFVDGNDACDQYDYVPTNGEIPDDISGDVPNVSFDLVRFGISVMEHLQHDDLRSFRDFIITLCRDDFGNYNFSNNESFDLYINIAHHCHNAVPIKVITATYFDKLQIPYSTIPAGSHIFKF